MEKITQPNELTRPETRTFISLRGPVLLTFEQWKKYVDVALVGNCGMGCDDLPDWHYYDAWDSEMSPFEAMYFGFGECMRGHGDGLRGRLRRGGVMPTRRIIWDVRRCDEPEQDLVQFAENEAGEWYQDAMGRIYCHNWGENNLPGEGSEVPRSWSVCNPPAYFDEDGKVTDTTVYKEWS